MQERLSPNAISIIEKIKSGAIENVITEFGNLGEKEKEEIANNKDFLNAIFTNLYSVQDGKIVKYFELLELINPHLGPSLKLVGVVTANMKERHKKPAEFGQVLMSEVEKSVTDLVNSNQTDEAIIKSTLLMLANLDPRSKNANEKMGQMLASLRGKLPEEYKYALEIISKTFEKRVEKAAGYSFMPSNDPQVTTYIGLPENGNQYQGLAFGEQAMAAVAPAEPVYAVPNLEGNAADQYQGLGANVGVDENGDQIEIGAGYTDAQNPPNPLRVPGPVFLDAGQIPDDNSSQQQMPAFPTLSGLKQSDDNNSDSAERGRIVEEERAKAFQEENIGAVEREQYQELHLGLEGIDHFPDAPDNLNQGQRTQSAAPRGDAINYSTLPRDRGATVAQAQDQPAAENLQQPAPRAQANPGVQANLPNAHADSAKKEDSGLKKFFMSKKTEMYFFGGLALGLAIIAPPLAIPALFVMVTAALSDVLKPIIGIASTVIVASLETVLNAFKILGNIGIAIKNLVSGVQTPYYSLNYSGAADIFHAFYPSKDQPPQAQIPAQSQPATPEVVNTPAVQQTQVQPVPAIEAQPAQQATPHLPEAAAGLAAALAHQQAAQQGDLRASAAAIAQASIPQVGQMPEAGASVRELQRESSRDSKSIRY